MLNFFPPYICECGHTMGVKLEKDGKWVPVDLGCQPGHCMKTKDTDEVDSSRKRQ